MCTYSRLSLYNSHFQERLQEESRLRAATLDELAKLKETRESLERQWEEERRRFEEEKKQMRRKETEDETRLSRMSSELAERKAQLDAKEKEVAEIQVWNSFLYPKFILALC